MPDPQSTAVGAPVILTDAIRQMEEAEFVLDFVRRSSAMRQPFIPIWDEIQDNYMVVPFGTTVMDAVGALLGIRTSGLARRTTETVSRLKDPETHQIVETLTSQALGLLLGADDYIKAVPTGVNSPEKARLISRLLMAVFESKGVYRTHYQAFKNAFQYGTSILETGWESRERTQMVKKPKYNPITGTIDGTEIRPESVLYRDRVLIREIPLRKFYPDPTGTRLDEDMIGAAKQFSTTYWKALEYGKAGVYDMAQVREAIRMSTDANVPKPTGYGDEEFLALAGIELPTKFGMANGLEYFGEVPFNRPGGRNRRITLVNGVWVCGRPNPYLDGEIPWDAITVNPIGGRFYGLSPAEVIRFLQDSADNFLMLFNDAGDLAVRSPMLIGQAFGGDPEKVRQRRVNDVIACRNVDAVKPLPVELGALTFAASEMARRKQAMRESSGATNPMQAIGSQGEKTATEINTLVGLASQRVTTMVQLVERDAYPAHARKIHSRIRQFAEPDILARLQGDVFHVKLEDIDVDADVRFLGSLQAGNAQQVTSQYTNLIQTLGSVPLAMVKAFPEVFVRLFRDGMRIPDAEVIVQQAIQMADQQEAQAQAQAAAGGGQSPTTTRGGSVAAPKAQPSSQPPASLKGGA